MWVHGITFKQLLSEIDAVCCIQHVTVSHKSQIIRTTNMYDQIVWFWPKYPIFNGSEGDTYMPLTTCLSRGVGRAVAEAKARLVPKRGGRELTRWPSPESELRGIGACGSLSNTSLVWKPFGICQLKLKDMSVNMRHWQCSCVSQPTHPQSS